MKTASQKNFNVRNLVIIVFILILLCGAVYKYLEWSTLQNLASLYNQTWSEEFSLVQDQNKNTPPWIQLTRQVFSTNGIKQYSIISSYDQLIGDLQLIISNQESYKSTIQQDEQAYGNINTWFLFGQRGDFAKKLVTDQLDYYKYESSDADISDASNWLNYNVISVLKDRAVVSKFYNETSSDYQTLIPQYWSDLSSLQKYTDSNFTFEHQDIIEKYYPNAFSALKQFQQYFSDYYSTMQDAVNGDYQSVAYKIPTLQQTGTSLNVNFNDLFNETKDQSNSNASNIIQLVSDESNGIKDFIAQGLYKYPLLPNITTKWKVDLVLCQMYDFKADAYHNLSSNYITATNTTALLNELSAISPNTQQVDSKFDKSLLKLENNDSQITFTCKDKFSNKSYQFITVK